MNRLYLSIYSYKKEEGVFESIVTLDRNGKVETLKQVSTKVINFPYSALIELLFRVIKQSGFVRKLHRDKMEVQR